MSDQEGAPNNVMEEQQPQEQNGGAEQVKADHGDGGDALPPPPPKPLVEREKSRDRSRERPSKRRGSRERSRSRERRRSSSRSRSRDRRRGKDRSRSRERKDRSRSRERRRRSRSPRGVSSRIGRSRSRDRRRSRSRDRSRRDSRSRSPPIPGLGGPLPPPPPIPGGGSVPPNVAALQAQQALQAQIQAQQAQQALQAQVQLLTAQANSAALLGDRRAREIFVGNLNRGLVSAEMLRELFNAVLANMVPDPVANPPVITARLDAQGKYGFVELRSPELASAATQLHKMELCGKPMTVERAKGFTDTTTHMQTAAQKMQQAQIFALQLQGGVAPALPGPPPIGLPGAPPLPVVPIAGAAALPGAPPLPIPVAPAAGPTTVVVLENVMNVGSIRNDQERRELQTDVYQEASKFGALTGIAIPVPPPQVPDGEPCRVYLKYGTPTDAQRCHQTMEGRMFDDNKVRAVYISEADFFRAQAGEWLPRH